MAKQNEHGKLIAAAAKAALLPLGCVRKGQSRTWFSDERYWYIFIEFQPSSWSKGTYFNVFPVWLFLRPWAGEPIHRVGDYISFESVEQFRPLIEEGAKLVAAEVIALRSKFATLLDIHRFFAGKLSWSGNIYRAAVTAGLIGDFALARQLFARVKALDPETRWLLWKIQADCADLDALLDDPVAYRSAVLETIAAGRQSRGLPSDPHCLEGVALPRRSQNGFRSA
jgi:hypothetical protein